MFLGSGALSLHVKRNRIKRACCSLSTQHLRDDSKSCTRVDSKNDSGFIWSTKHLYHSVPLFPSSDQKWLCSAERSPRPTFTAFCLTRGQGHNNQRGILLSWCARVDSSQESCATGHWNDTAPSRAPHVWSYSRVAAALATLRLMQSGAWQSDTYRYWTRNELKKRVLHLVFT